MNEIRRYRGIETPCMLFNSHRCCFRVESGEAVRIEPEWKKFGRNAKTARAKEWNITRHSRSSSSSSRMTGRSNRQGIETKEMEMQCARYI